MEDFVLGHGVRVRVLQGVFMVVFVWEQCVANEKVMLAAKFRTQQPVFIHLSEPDTNNYQANACVVI